MPYDPNTVLSGKCHNRPIVTCAHVPTGPTTGGLEPISSGEPMAEPAVAPPAPRPDATWDDVRIKDSSRGGKEETGTLVFNEGGFQVHLASTARGDGERLVYPYRRIVTAATGGGGLLGFGLLSSLRIDLVRPAPDRPSTRKDDAVEEASTMGRERSPRP